MDVVEAEIQTEVKCYHCGQPCTEENIEADEKNFCCYGCKTVYEILSENNLCEYYSFDQNPGVSLRYVSDETYGYLDEPSVRKKILLFDSESFATAHFFIPAIHCISCIWLLENLQRINRDLLKSEVHFGGKRLTVSYNPSKISLGGVARLLASLGYAPQINLEEKKGIQSSSKDLVTRLAVAGFCFGNIMLLSFPEYLGLDKADHMLGRLFSFLNLGLGLLTAIYSGRDYFIASWKSFRQTQINIDVPIAIGLFALFARSAYDIISNTGPGYLDSLSGLVFFLLIGRWFQDKTYESLSFERDYKSYFPLAVQKNANGSWVSTLVYELLPGDEIMIRNREIIPADAVLLSDNGYIDYSFVTGESKPVRVKAGDVIYAGGRLIGSPARLKVDKKTSQSNLTSLWNNAAFTKPAEHSRKRIIDQTARSFTWLVLGIALITAVYWYFVEPSRMWLILTSVLMVACPCALALATPFTYGSMLRVFGRHGFYLKNADVIERLATIDTIVFDKTGTLTHGTAEIKFMGSLSSLEERLVKRLAAASTHPLSTLISKNSIESIAAEIIDFKEIPGKGIEGVVDGKRVRIGSADFLSAESVSSDNATHVYVEIENEYKGYFRIEANVRKELSFLLKNLKSVFVSLLSGDHDGDKTRMNQLFPANAPMLFNQSPHDKLAYISNLQKQGRKVIMIGDGLNDAGALKQSDIGIAVTDDSGIFTPACDGILQGGQLKRLNAFLSLGKNANTILKIAYAISFFYNTVALGFAVSGHLTPLIAAILMPISSISVVGFSTLAVNHVARRKFGKVEES